MRLPGLFLNAKSFQEVPAGTLIFEAGASGTEMFGIVEGEVEVRLPNGAVRRLGPDETFGEVLATVARDPGIDVVVVPLTMATAGRGAARARHVSNPPPPPRCRILTRCVSTLRNPL